MTNIIKLAPKNKKPGHLNIVDGFLAYALNKKELNNLCDVIKHQLASEYALLQASFKKKEKNTIRLACTKIKTISEKYELNDILKPVKNILELFSKPDSSHALAANMSRLEVAIYKL